MEFARLEFTDKIEALRFGFENYGAIVKHPEEEVFVFFHDVDGFSWALKNGYEILDDDDWAAVCEI